MCVGGFICLWFLYVFSMHWYFLIFSYKLTVSNGFSLTVWKCIAVTFSSSSFIWGGLSAFGICIFIYTGISLYFLISWLFRMGSHWQYENAWLSLSRQAVSNGGTICLWYLYPYIYWYFLIFSNKLTAFGIYMFSLHWYFLISSYYLTVSNGCSLTALKSVEVTQSSGSFKWGGPSVFGICILIYTGISLYFLISWLPLVSTCFLCTGISLYLPIIWLFRMGTHWLHWKA